MKKKYIYILISVVSVAMLGLIVLQIYWINNAVNLKKEEFKRDVRGALYTVSTKLEKIEALARIKNHEKGRRLLMQQAKKLKNQPQSDSALVIYEDNGIKYQISEKYNADSSSNWYQKSIQSKNNSGNTYFELNIGVRGASNQSNGKTAMVDELVQSLYEINVYRTISERIDKQVLDSLLKTEFLNRGIDTKYQYGVFDYYGKGLILDSLYNAEKIRHSGYFAQLFPNDFVQDPHFLSVYFPHQTGFLLKTMWIMLFVSSLFLITIVGGFTYTVRTIIRQKKLSEIKNDFISNMTHELKTPISTISLACEALGDKDISSNEQVKSNYLSMISQENRRLGLLVESVLKSALWDKGELKLKYMDFNLHETIMDVVENIQIQIEKKNGRIQTEFSAQTPFIKADKVHITNIIYNLIDNANKYSLKNPQIKVKTENTDKGVVIYISDNGIGIRKENIAKIFDKFYRVPTGNVHDVKGFGLGLNYVKALVDAHQGQITVDSEYGVGTTFKLFFPFDTSNSNN